MLEVPTELALSMVFPIFKGKGELMNCSCYRAVQLLEHGMEVVEWVLKIIHRIVAVNKMHYGFMPERGTIDVVFILRRLHEDYRVKGKMYMCFVDLVDRIPREFLE